MPGWPLAAQTFRSARSALLANGNTTAETLRGSVLVEGRVIGELYPGQVSGAGGMHFRGPNSSAGARTPSGVPIGDMRLEGMVFRVPFDMAAVSWDNYWSGSHDGGWEAPNWWGWGDWRFNELYDRGLSKAYGAALDRARTLVAQLGNTVDWIPTDIRSRWLRAIGVGGMPMMLPVSVMRAEGSLPAWLNTENRQHTWEVAREGLRLLNQEVTASNLNALTIQAANIQKDVAFWDTVARWSGADLVERKWSDLKASIRQFNANKKTIDENLAKMRETVDTMPEDVAAFTTAQLATIDRIELENTEATIRARNAIDGPIMGALLDEGYGINGLGIAPVVVISIGVAAIAAAATVIAIEIRTQAQLTRESNQHVHELAMAKEKALADMAAREQAQVHDQQQRVMTMYENGELTDDQRAAMMNQISTGWQSFTGWLTTAQEQASSAVALYNENQKEQQEGTLAQVLGQSKWLVVAGTALLAVWYGGPILKQMVSKK